MLIYRLVRTLITSKRFDLKLKKRNRHREMRISSLVRTLIRPDGRVGLGCAPGRVGSVCQIANRK